MTNLEMLALANSGPCPSSFGRDAGDFVFLSEFAACKPRAQVGERR
jgi:hypothetical protein